MTCNEITEFLMDYLSGDLPQAMSKTFESHVAVCADCRRYLDSYRKTIALSQQSRVAIEPVPENLVAAIMSSRKTRPAD
jgi:anti-sigma factor RsiW